MSFVHVQIGSESASAEVAAGTTLLDAIRASGLSTSFPCGGKGRCGKCKVSASGELSQMSEQERCYLNEDELKTGIRLACFAKVSGDCFIRMNERAEDAVIANNYVEWDGEVLPLYEDGYGAAFDIGTTTVAAQLYHCGSKRPVAVQGELNRQQTYGGDVISRIVYCNEHTVQPLSFLIRTQLSDMLRSLCAEAGISHQDIHQLVITGNTTMMYLLFAIEPAPLAIAPFYMEQGFKGSFDARLPGFEGIPCYVPGCASAYIGADITCSVLASGMAGRSGNYLLVDAGTNGEMVLSSNGRLICCSTAAGPAFEGAGITCGGNASLGAIDSVRYEDGTFSYTTIGGAPADKLCGSGLIDAVAALLEAGMITKKGKLKTESGGEFYFGNSPVYLTQKDVRQLQLAKAAIRAGMDTLIHASGLEYDDMNQIILCGGFGSYLRPSCAERIGLIPPGFTRIAVAIGNAAGNGAGRILQSREQLEESERIVSHMETVELASNPYFHDRYFEAMLF